MISNYHVLANRHCDTDDWLENRRLTPSRVRCLLPRSPDGLWAEERLTNAGQKPRWSRSNAGGIPTDVAVLPIAQPLTDVTVFKREQMLPFSEICDGLEVYVLGFPAAAPEGQQCVPVQGNITDASPGGQLEGWRYSLKAQTGKGFSGSPVVLQKDGEVLLAGIYAGRKAGPGIVFTPDALLAQFK